LPAIKSIQSRAAATCSGLAPFSEKINERGLVLNDFEDQFNSGFRPAWARVWHIWHLMIPRRAIDGAIVWGRVWRRHDGRRWIYKPIVDFEEL
jgi:hypothetical protein